MDSKRLACENSDTAELRASRLSDRLWSHNLTKAVWQEPLFGCRTRHQLSVRVGESTQWLRQFNLLCHEPDTHEGVL